MKKLLLLLVAITILCCCNDAFAQKKDTFFNYASAAESKAEYKLYDSYVESGAATAAVNDAPLGGEVLLLGGFALAYGMLALGKKTQNLIEILSFL